MPGQMHRCTDTIYTISVVSLSDYNTNDLANAAYSVLRPELQTLLTVCLVI